MGGNMAIDWSLFDPQMGAKLGAAIDPAVIQEKQNKLADLASERQMRQIQLQQAVEGIAEKRDEQRQRREAMASLSPDELQQVKLGVPYKDIIERKRQDALASALFKTEPRQYQQGDVQAGETGYSISSPEDAKAIMAQLPKIQDPVERAKIQEALYSGGYMHPPTQAPSKEQIAQYMIAGGKGAEGLGKLYEQKVDYNKPFLPDGTPNVAYQAYQQSLKGGKGAGAGGAVTGSDVGAQTAPMQQGGIFPALKDPYQNLSQKARENIIAKEAQAGAKQLEEAGQRIQALDAADQLADEFIRLNKNVATGGVLDKFAGGAIGALSDDYNRMQTITAKLAPKERAPGSGATSDFDAKQFERATLSTSNKGSTNMAIAAAIKAQNANERDYLQFKQAYFDEKGTLRGADVAWKQYADSNPIFDKSKEGTFALNPRRESWMDYFSKRSGMQTSAPAKSQGMAGAHPADIQDLLNRYGG